MEKLILTRRPRRPVIRLILLPMLPAAAAGAILWLSRTVGAGMVEQVYSRRIFVAIASVLGIPARLVPFSLAAVLLVAAVLFVLFMLIRLFVLLLRRPGRLRTLLRYGYGTLFTASCIALLFAAACAPNYERLTFSEQSGLVLRDSSADELAGLCDELLENAETARRGISESDGVMVLSDSVYGTARNAQAAFDALSGKYPFVGEARVAPKPIPASEVLSILNLTGFYFPYTAEANVNVHMPAMEIPFTMCHELAHTAGFMREDEANFLAYLACSGSDLADLRYSGMLYALNQSMNALYSADRERYFTLRSAYSEGLDADLFALSAYWQKYFDTPAAKVSTTVNDTYLKANNQKDGTRSYGRMVDLLLADFRARHGLL